MAFKEKKTVHEKLDAELVRRFKTRPFIFVGTFIVLVIVVVAFVLVPAIVPNSGFSRDIDLTFGYYDNIPISYVPGNYFAQYYDMAARYRQSAANSEIWRDAFEGAVIHTAILHEMKKSGYTAPSKMVDRDVARLPQFQENGRFSSALYRRMDDNQRLSLWRQAQEDIAKEHFHSDVTGLLKPAAEGEFIGKMAAAQRSFDMMVFSVDAYPEAEYEAYIREHADLFRSVHLSKITINSGEREARKVLDSIKNGEITFEDAAKAHSKDAYADKGGDMGIKMAHELRTDIPEETERENIIVLARDQYSDMVKTDTGWSFFRAEESVQEADASDETVLEKVRFYVRNFERGRMEDWAIAQADRFIALAHDVGFEEALFRQEITKRSFGPIPLNYNNVDLFPTLVSQSGSGLSSYELSISSSDENFWKVAFSTPVETLSQPVVQGSNVLVLFPTEEIEAEESVIEDIISAYNSYWLSYVSDQSMRQHFMKSPKMKDNFPDIYFRYFMNHDE